MKLSERTKELERIIAYRENHVPDHKNESIPGWMYLQTIKEYLSDLQEVAQLKAENEALREAGKEAMEEIVYQHGDMLTKEERGHPRGSGWARVYDKLNALLAGESGD